MEKVYKIKKGKHYSKGDKSQEIIWPILLLIFGVVIYVSPNMKNIFGSISIASSFLLYIIMCFRFIKNEASVFFSKECLYKLNDNFDQINKLYGVSFGKVHSDSARFGWRCTNEKNIEIFAYCYINKERVYRKICECNVEEWVNLNLIIKPKFYEFTSELPDGEISKIKIEKKGKFKFYKLFIYKLFPYFGGKIPSPHDMEIKIIQKDK